MIPLICIDVDGTLVGSTGIVRDPVWKAVDAAVSRGQHLAITTARGAFGSSWEMAKRLDPQGWHVFHAGGAIVRTPDAQSRAHEIDPEVVDLAQAAASEHNWILELYSATEYAVDSDAPAAIDHAKLMDVPFVRRDLNELRGTNDAIVRAQFVVEVHEVDAVHAALAHTGLSVTSATSPIMPGIAFVSATRSGITKATGIAMIGEDLGIAMSDIMMVGDGLNDLPAIEAVGHPVAMGNAETAVKDASRYQVADVEADGLAEALELSATL